jgi:hypothetical protein
MKGSRKGRKARKFREWLKAMKKGVQMPKKDLRIKRRDRG